jgi:hypothetical protein
VRHRALAAQVRHRHDRAAAGRLHQRLRRTCTRNERVGADVQRQPEAVARRVGKAPFEIFRGRERNGVDEQVELPAECLPDLFEDTVHVVVGADVARRHEQARDRVGELADALLDAIALIGECQLRAAVGETLCDRPRDRALVGDAQNQAALALIARAHRASLNG